MIGLHEKFQLSLGRIIELQEKEKELERAQALIARLRAENAVLKDENAVLKDEKKCILSCIDDLKRHICIAGNTHKKWAVTFVKTQIKKRFFL